MLCSKCVDGAGLVAAEPCSVLSCAGESYLFVFGGSSIEEQALQDWHFLKLEENTWTQVRAGTQEYGVDYMAVSQCTHWWYLESDHSR